MMPSVGRIVHYVTKRGKVRPAIITAVHGPDLVNLNVFADAEDGFASQWYETSVRREAETGLVENNVWRWPPMVGDKHD